MPHSIGITLAVTLAAVALSGCTTVEPGHMGLMFHSLSGGLQRDQLQPGTYWTGPFSRVEDFDITYSTRKEAIETTSTEGLLLNLKFAVIYRPVSSELYNLDSEIGLNYYDEVIGPEFRSAARGVFAHHDYRELLKKNEAIEDEVEADLRRRIVGKHVEISSVTLEEIEYAPAISKAVQEKLAAEQDAIRQKAIMDNEDARRRMQLANEAEQKALQLKVEAEQRATQQKNEAEQRAMQQRNEAEQRSLQQKNEAEQRALELKNEAEQARFRDETAMRKMKIDVELAKQQAVLDKIRAESEATSQLIKARSEAEQAKYRATAKAAEARATNEGITPLTVTMHGYDAIKEALKDLGSSDTHIYLGDWTKLPNFLYPPNFKLDLGHAPPTAPSPAPTP